MVTLIIFFIVLSVLVLVHEWGHFVVARRAGVKVEEFGLGFPPRLFAWQRGETLYSINLIPFGGFVKIFGEDTADIKEKGSFGSIKIYKRAQVLVAGVIMNFLLAVVLLALVSGLGRPTIIDETNEAVAKDIGVQVLQVLPKTPAADANFKAGDKIEKAAIRGEEVVLANVESFQEFVQNHQGEEIEVTVARREGVVTLLVTPRIDVPDGEGPIGISLARVGLVSSPWWRALWDGLVVTINLTITIFVLIVQLLAGLITGNSLVANLAGPIGIATLTGEAARLGLVYLLQFTALLSINLAILNILPFPALDGGRLVFLAIEKIKGRPVKKEIEQAVNLVGFALLLLLMIIVTWQDITRFL